MLMLGLALPAGAAQLTGRARVIDGDTIALGVVKVRLHGVDAPEMAQSCRRAGESWACGRAARKTLEQLAGGARVRCTPVDVDRYGRIVAQCAAGGIDDLGAALVARGMAFAYRRYSRDYVDEEQAARAARRGVWAGEARRPEAFRRAGDDPAPIPASAPAGGKCRIKGNITARGRIFHRPGDASYARTRIDRSAGERWFCSVAAARDAGWRAPRN